MITLKQLKNVKTLDDLKELGIGEVYVNVSHRGGGVGFYGRDVACAFEIDEYYLPEKFGAGCNYLGGGIRGSIFPSDYSDKIEPRKRKMLDALADSCVKVYESIENEIGLNTEDCDGEINWEARATCKVRQSGITSSY
jgi:hypothetical protein